MRRCTSAVVPSNDGPLYLRIMDWGAHAFWPLCISIVFESSGRPVYSGVGFVSLQTGLRPQGWSVGLNYRQVQVKCPTDRTANCCGCVYVVGCLGNQQELGGRCYWRLARVISDPTNTRSMPKLLRGTDPAL